MGVFDAARASRHAARLAMPRLTGTEGEQNAASYIKEEFQNAGLEVTEEQFFCSGLTWQLTRIFLIAIALFSGSLLRDSSPGMALVISGFPFVLGFLAFIGFPRLTRASPGDVNAGSQSSNLITAPVGRGNYRVYLLAHYDSKGQGIPLLVRMLCASLLFLSLLLLLIHDIDRYCFGVPDASWAMPVAALGLLCTLILFALRASNSSPGALDNASGTGVLLELGRAVSTHPIPNVEVVLSALGARSWVSSGRRNSAKGIWMSLPCQTNRFWS
jgi:hypothetical protein